MRHARKSCYAKVQQGHWVPKTCKVLHTVTSYIGTFENVCIQGISLYVATGQDIQTEGTSRQGRPVCVKHDP